MDQSVKLVIVHSRSDHYHRKIAYSECVGWMWIGFIFRSEQRIYNKQNKNVTRDVSASDIPSVGVSPFDEACAILEYSSFCFTPAMNRGWILIFICSDMCCQLRSSINQLSSWYCILISSSAMAFIDLSLTLFSILTFRSPECRQPKRQFSIAFHPKNTNYEKWE